MNYGTTIWALCYEWPGDEWWVIHYFGQHVKAEDIRLKRERYEMAAEALERKME